MSEPKFKLEFKPSVVKTLETLTDNTRLKIFKKISQLEIDPYKDAKKLKGSEFWRIRVGDYRIIYTIDNGVLLVLVLRIGLRKEIYRKL